MECTVSVCLQNHIIIFKGTTFRVLLHTLSCQEIKNDNLKKENRDLERVCHLGRSSRSILNDGKKGSADKEGRRYEHVKLWDLSAWESERCKYLFIFRMFEILKKITEHFFRLLCEKLPKFDSEITIFYKHTIAFTNIFSK